MKFLYKIYSGHDGFSPRRIPERLQKGKLLRLGWARYIDVVEEGWEVWVYFHGPHKFTPGVYVKGFVQSIHAAEKYVLLKVRECSTSVPLSNEDTSNRVADIVAPRYRQVFILPEAWEPAPQCTVGSSASSCAARQCGNCGTWKALRLIDPKQLGAPRRLPGGLDAHVPAFWAIPSRCYLVQQGTPLAKDVCRTSELFYRFKLGDADVGYPLALGIYEALRRRKLLDFDAVVPIPLSPNKVTSGELHRTRALAMELAQLLGAPVADVLSLTKPISKRVLRSCGYTAREFEREYYEALSVDEGVRNHARLVLVDDVCTEGSTLRAAFARLRDAHPDCRVVTATAAQMIMKAVVRDESAVVASATT